jgi:beta-phosphoglucomutase-like phosphatase (HAD superfamily)
MKKNQKMPVSDDRAVFQRTQETANSPKAVIFDMDGILIDSEPFWRKAEMDVFKTVGIQLTENMCFETMGLRVDEIINYWYRRQPWKNFVAGQLEKNIIDAVIEQILLNGEAKAGIDKSIKYFRGKGLKTALASSSSYRIIHAVIKRLGIAEKFDCVYSAEEEEYGKPHPGVYINTARKLLVEPSECIAIEDSFNGILAAKAARMRCIAIPEDFTRIDPRFIIADMTLSSLSKIGEKVWKQILKY